MIRSISQCYVPFRVVTTTFDQQGELCYGTVIEKALS